MDDGLKRYTLMIRSFLMVPIILSYFDEENPLKSDGCFREDKRYVKKGRSGN